MRKHRQAYRKRRKSANSSVVALVGYTNAGKSTLINALSRSDVMAEDTLFATLGQLHAQASAVLRLCCETPFCFVVHFLCTPSLVN